MVWNVMVYVSQDANQLPVPQGVVRLLKKFKDVVKDSQVNIVAFSEFDSSHNENSKLNGSYVFVKGAEENKDESAPVIETKLNKEIDTGNSATFKKFIETIIKKIPKNQGDNYLLYFSGHGAGLSPSSPKYKDGSEQKGCCYSRKSPEGISVEDLHENLKKFHQHFGKPIDIVFMDACLMQMIEIPAYINHEQTLINYYCASQAVVSKADLGQIDGLYNILKKTSDIPVDSYLQEVKKFVLVENINKITPNSPEGANFFSILDVRKISEAILQLDKIFETILAEFSPDDEEKDNDKEKKKKNFIKKVIWKVPKFTSSPKLLTQSNQREIISFDLQNFIGFSGKEVPNEIKKMLKFTPLSNWDNKKANMYYKGLAKTQCENYCDQLIDPIFKDFKAYKKKHKKEYKLNTKLNKVVTKIPKKELNYGIAKIVPKTTDLNVYKNSIKRILKAGDSTAKEDVIKVLVDGYFDVSPNLDSYVTPTGISFYLKPITSEKIKLILKKIGLNSLVSLLGILFEEGPTFLSKDVFVGLSEKVKQSAIEKLQATAFSASNFVAPRSFNDASSLVINGMKVVFDKPISTKNIALAPTYNYDK